MVINNKVIIQWGRGTFTSGGTSETHYTITLPTAVKTIVTPTINADVGSSGWTYLNGISCYTYSKTTFGGRYCLGRVAGTWYTWIAIGY